MQYMTVLSRLQRPGYELEREAFLAAMYHGFGRDVDSEARLGEYLSQIVSSGHGGLMIRSLAPAAYQEVLRKINDCDVSRDLHEARITPDAVTPDMTDTLRVARVYAEEVGGRDGVLSFRRGLSYVRGAINRNGSDPKTRFAIASIVLGMSVLSGPLASVAPTIKVTQALLNTHAGQEFQRRLSENVRAYLATRGYEPDFIDRLSVPVAELWDRTAGTRLGKAVFVVMIPLVVGIGDAVETYDGAKEAVKRAWALLGELKTFVTENAADLWDSIAVDKAEAASTATFQSGDDGFDLAAWAIASSQAQQAPSLDAAMNLICSVGPLDQFTDGLAAAANGDTLYQALPAGMTARDLAEAHAQTLLGPGATGEVVANLMGCESLRGHPLHSPLPEGPIRLPGVDTLSQGITLKSSSAAMTM